MFSKSLGIRHLNCGSCNGCEQELNAVSNTFYDITRDGWDIVASPRHADVITVTGPMTEAMRQASRDTIEAASKPCIVLGIGDCAAGIGPWKAAKSAGDGAAIELEAHVLVLGCPPSPNDIREGLRAAAKRLNRKLTVGMADPSPVQSIHSELHSTVPWNDTIKKRDDA